MKMKIRKVYHCSYCKKYGLTGPSIERHESHCTGNPDRYCRMCDDGPLTFDIDVQDHHNWEGSLSWVEKVIDITGDECPSCVLAFVRQNKITTINVPKDKNEGFDSWDYKRAVKRWWQNNNKNEW